MADDARRGSTGLHRTVRTRGNGDTAPVAAPAGRQREEARIYRDLATRRSGEDQEILLGLADAEERHAAHWSRLLGEEAGGIRRGSVRLRLLAFLARRFGSVFVLALAQRAETRSPYRTDRDATPSMAADERVEEVVEASPPGAAHGCPARSAPPCSARTTAWSATCRWWWV